MALMSEEAWAGLARAKFWESQDWANLQRATFASLGSKAVALAGSVLA